MSQLDRIEEKQDRLEEKLDKHIENSNKQHLQIELTLNTLKLNEKANFKMLTEHEQFINEVEKLKNKTLGVLAAVSVIFTIIGYLIKLIFK